MSWSLRYEEGYSGSHTVVRGIRVCKKGLKQGRKMAGRLGGPHGAVGQLLAPRNTWQSVGSVSFGIH